MVQVEAFPLSSKLIRDSEETLFVSSSEGSVFSIQIMLNSLNQKSIFSNLHFGPITHIDSVSIFNHQQNLFVTSSFDQTVKIWKPNFTKSLAIQKHKDFVTCFSLNGNQNPFILASGDSEGNLLIKNILQGKQRKNLFSYNTGNPIRSLAWSNQGNKLGILNLDSTFSIITPNKSSLQISREEKQILEGEARELELFRD
jgi:WD40 repeat protein